MREGPKFVHVDPPLQNDLSQKIELAVPEGGVGSGPALGRGVAALVLGVRVVGGGGAALQALLVKATPGRERDPRVHHHLPPVAGWRQTRRRQAAPCVRHLCGNISRENIYSFGE